MMMEENTNDFFFNEMAITKITLSKENLHCSRLANNTFKMFFFSHNRNRWTSKLSMSTAIN